MLVNKNRCHNAACATHDSLLLSLSHSLRYSFVPNHTHICGVCHGRRLYGNIVLVGPDPGTAHEEVFLVWPDPKESETRVRQELIVYRCHIALVYCAFNSVSGHQGTDFV